MPPFDFTEIIFVEIEANVARLKESWEAKDIETFNYRYGELNGKLSILGNLIECSNPQQKDNH